MEKDEVICISSDDEDVEQNNTNNKVECPNDYDAQNIKEEVISNNNDSSETCGQKRKASDITSSNDEESDSERHTKVFVHEKENKVVPDWVAKKEKAKEKVKEKEKGKENENEEERKEEEEEEKSNKSLPIPQLVVKEKKTIAPIEQDIFPMFISLCLQKDRSEEMEVIVDKLKRRYEQLDPAYANSEAFIDYLNEKRNDIMYSKNKLYIHIAEVMNEMKSSCKGKSSLLNGKSVNRLSTTNDTTISNMLRMSNSTGNDSPTKADNEEQEKQDAVQRKIRLLLKTMKKCERYIKKLEEAEVNFDDDNNSNYIKLEKYKCRMVELFRKYCEYTGDNADAGRQYLRPKHFSSTGIVAVDHAITNFINSKISKRNSKKVGTFTDTLIFPDYNDILKCVKKCNELRNLGLDNKKQQHIAKKAFTELGEYLQRCRRNDYWDTFSLFLENKEDDPALKDSMLAEKLTQNKAEGEKKLANVFEEFVKKQEEIKDQITGSKTSSEDEEEEEEEEEDSAENEEEGRNEDNEISETEDSLDMEEDKTSSTDEDEKSADGNKKSRNRTDASKSIIKESNETGVGPEVIEVEEAKQLKIAEKSNGKDSKLKAVKTDCDADTSDGNSNPKTQASKESGGTSSTCLEANTSASDVQTTTASNLALVDRTKVDESNTVNEARSDEDRLKEEKTKKVEGEEKPLLRVRSFARPPTTWEDVQEIVDVNENASKKSMDKDVIDLTSDSPKENCTVNEHTRFQIGSKVLPIEVMKGKYKTLVIPAGKSIINVKNITNNFVRVNAKDVDLSNVHKTVGRVERSKMNTYVPLNAAINQRKNATGNQVRNPLAKQKNAPSQISSNPVASLSRNEGKNTSSPHPKANPSRTQAK